MLKVNDNKIVTIVINDVYIPNPRDRNKFTHSEIKENIKKIGLKRPITVRKIKNSRYKYALICGQGRLEAYIEHGEKNIPAIIKDVDENTAYIMSITENIARRNPRSPELLQDIRKMKEGGLTNKEIATRLGYQASWVNDIMSLLFAGEKNLLRAYENGHIPLYLAVRISRVKSDDNQILLASALEKGHIKGHQINIIKQILKSRELGNKDYANENLSSVRKRKKLTSEELSSLYEKNIEENKLILRKSEIVKEKIIAVKKIYTKLLTDHEFFNLLKSNGFSDIPAILNYRNNKDN